MVFVVNHIKLLPPVQWDAVESECQGIIYCKPREGLTSMYLTNKHAFRALDIDVNSGILNQKARIRLE